MSSPFSASPLDSAHPILYKNWTNNNNEVKLAERNEASASHGNNAVSAPITNLDSDINIAISVKGRNATVLHDNNLVRAHNLIPVDKKIRQCRVPWHWFYILTVFLILFFAQLGTGWKLISNPDYSCIERGSADVVEGATGCLDYYSNLGPIGAGYNVSQARIVDAIDSAMNCVQQTCNSFTPRVNLDSSGVIILNVVLVYFFAFLGAALSFHDFVWIRINYCELLCYTLVAMILYVYLLITPFRDLFLLLLSIPLSVYCGPLIKMVAEKINNWKKSSRYCRIITSCCEK